MVHGDRQIISVSHGLTVIASKRKYYTDSQTIPHQALHIFDS